MRKENKVEFIEMVELFAVSTIHDLHNGYEVPKLNVLFKEEDLSVFRYVMKHPFKEDGFSSPDIKEEDIKELLPKNNQKKDIPIIKVEDATLFFDALTRLTNSYITFYAKHGIQSSARSTGIYILRRIWLRMGKEDFNNVEQFLEKQIEFTESTFMDEERFKKNIGEFYDYDVYLESAANTILDETCGKVELTIGSGEEQHELPNIYCSFDKDNTCYIYAIQDKKNKKTNKKIERLLYKLNAGIENPNIHPNHVYALIKFLEYIKKKGVEKVIVPKQQVLSYSYHKKLGEKEKEEYERNWPKEKVEEMNKYPKYMQEELLNKYKWDSKWYSHIVDKADFIEKAKTEGLYNLVDRMKHHIPDIEIINNEESDYIEVSLTNIKQKRLII